MLETICTDFLAGTNADRANSLSTDSSVATGCQTLYSIQPPFVAELSLEPGLIGDTLLVVWKAGTGRSLGYPEGNATSNRSIVA